MCKEKCRGWFEELSVLCGVTSMAKGDCVVYTHHFPSERLQAFLVMQGRANSTRKGRPREVNSWPKSHNKLTHLAQALKAGPGSLSVMRAEPHCGC